MAAGHVSPGRGRRSFSSRLAIAKQFLAAAGAVLAGRNPARRVRSALRRLAGAPSAPSAARREAPALRCLRGAPLDVAGPICLFVAYAPDGRLFDHTVRYCADLRRGGLGLVLVVITDRPDLECRDPGQEAADTVLVRENQGYDFAAWADALRFMPEIWQAPELWFANDSVYHSPRLLASMIARVRASRADIVAATASTEVAPHFQSYFFALKATPDRRLPARNFWDGVSVLEDKLQVIRDYEVRQKSVLEAGGLTLEVLYPLPPDPRNHLQERWRALLDAGFPFVKIELLRDNPHRVDLGGWRDLLDAHGFDTAQVAFHLGARASGAAALMEVR
ncbi:MAG: rhamnan synthesis F family protein [Pseudomonadota bacterium]